jgi:hypothetical protein
MNRRHFLGSLSALAAGMVLDPDLALWRPGRTTYFDIVRPPVRPWAGQVALQDAVGRVAWMSVALPVPLELGETVRVEMNGGQVAPLLFTGRVIGLSQGMDAGVQFAYSARLAPHGR